MNARRRALWLVLVGLIAFNVWHAQYRGIWHPASVIGSLNLSADRVDRLREVDASLRPNGSYDGQFFYLMTLDPLLARRSWVSLFDAPIYRYRRMLYPLLAHVAALGRPRAYPYALLLVNLLFYLGGGWVVSRLARQNGWTQWVVAGYLANTGLVFCAFHTLAEPAAMALSLAGILFWRARKSAIGAGCFALSVLAREPFVIVPLAVAAWEWREAGGSRRRCAALAVATVVPFACWLCYLHLRLPAESVLRSGPESLAAGPQGVGVGRFSLPLVSIVQESLYGMHHLTTSTEIKRTLSLSVVALLLLAWTAVGFVRRPGFWGFLAVTQGALVSVLRGDIWNYHVGSARVLIPLFVFATLWTADELAHDPAARSRRPAIPLDRRAAGTLVSPP